VARLGFHQDQGRAAEGGIAFLPSPLAGEGAERRSREAGEGVSKSALRIRAPLTRLTLASLGFATLSRRKSGLPDLRIKNAEPG
jgi:hypothetical protein